MSYTKFKVGDKVKYYNGINFIHFGIIIGFLNDNVINVEWHDLFYKIKYINKYLLTKISEEEYNKFILDNF